MPPTRAASAKQTVIDTPNKDDTVTVEESGSDRVVVRWTCGGGRSFTRELLREHLKNFSLVAAQGDVYYTGLDSSGAEFYASLDGNIIKIADDLSTDADGVSFAKLRTAINRHTKPAAKPRTKKKTK